MVLHLVTQPTNIETKLFGLNSNMRNFTGPDGQIAAITGGGGVIGTAFATGLVAAGVKVAILDIDEQKANSVAEQLGAGAKRKISEKGSDPNRTEHPAGRSGNWGRTPFRPVLCVSFTVSESHTMKKLILTFALILLSSELLPAQVVRERDIIYQRVEGVALTMDVFVPEKPNGIGIIKIVSGGWKSRHSSVNDLYSKPYTDHGYTVFAVVHGSQPRYKVREIMGFMHRAVRFIRTNADRWSIDPDRIGVTGSSAGGHLSLILAAQGGLGDPKAKDPVDRASSAVQAAAVFYPPTDYLNWSEPGEDCVGVGKQARWQPAFGDESKTAEGRQVLGRHMSSIYHISDKTAPISIIHGDADPVVPLFQSQSFKRIAESYGVPIELVVKEGAQHGWPNKEADEVQFLNWFNRHLLK